MRTQTRLHKRRRSQQNGMCTSSASLVRQASSCLATSVIPPSLRTVISLTPVCRYSQLCVHTPKDGHDTTKLRKEPRKRTGDKTFHNRRAACCMQLVPHPRTRVSHTPASQENDRFAALFLPPPLKGKQQLRHSFLLFISPLPVRAAAAATTSFLLGLLFLLFLRVSRPFSSCRTSATVPDPRRPGFPQPLLQLPGPGPCQKASEGTSFCRCCRRRCPCRCTCCRW